MDEREPHQLPQLPRGATWHAVWLLPLLVLLAILLIPWSDEPPPVSRRGLVLGSTSGAVSRRS